MNESARSAFALAGLSISLDSDRPFRITDGFIPFLTEEEPDYTVLIREQDELPPFPMDLVYECMEYRVAEDGFSRQFLDALAGGIPYAVSQSDWAKKQICIVHTPAGRAFLNETGNCFFHIGLEKLLIAERRMILHSALVDTPLGGLVFCGESGAGKSTQAELWRQYAGARLINGDRTVLFRENESWMGYGSPYAGSSRCYRNEGCRIRAAVFPQKAPHCAVRRLRGAEAFGKLFSCVTVNSWDRDFVQRVCSLVEQFLAGIPVYELSCTPDRDSVLLLQNELKKIER